MLRVLFKDVLSFSGFEGMTSHGVPRSTYPSMEELISTIIITLLEEKARATLHQCSHTVITSMELTRFVNSPHRVVSLYNHITCPLLIKCYSFFCIQGYLYKKEYEKVTPSKLIASFNLIILCIYFFIIH